MLQLNLAENTCYGLLNSGRNISTNSGGDTRLVASKLSAEGDVNISSTGKVALASGVNSVLHKEKSERDTAAGMWFENRDAGTYDETLVFNEISSANNNINFNAAKGIEVNYNITKKETDVSKLTPISLNSNAGEIDTGYRDTQTIDEFVDKQVSEGEGYAYLQDLQNSSNVSWVGKSESHTKWEIESQGLTEVGMAVVAIAAAVAK